MLEYIIATICQLIASLPFVDFLGFGIGAIFAAACYYAPRYFDVSHSINRKTYDIPVIRSIPLQPITMPASGWMLWPLLPTPRIFVRAPQWNWLRRELIGLRY